MRLLLVYIISFMLVHSAIAQNAAIEEIHAFQENSALINASWTLKAKNLKTGEEIVSINAEQSLIPASTMKIITTGIALNEFGPDYRFGTILAFSGKISDDSILDGDLIIIGGGDPSFGMSHLNEVPHLKWLEILQKYGVKRITGKLIVDVSRYTNGTTPDTWVYQDLGNYYGASPSALSYSNNTFQITFAQSKKEGESTHILFPEEGKRKLKFINHVVSGPRGSGDNAYVYGFPGTETYIIRGTIPPGFGTFNIKASMPNPPEWFLADFRRILNENGIDVSGDDTIFNLQNLGYSILDTFYSPRLSELIKEVNVNSNNLFAEHLQLELSRLYTDINTEKIAKEYFEKNDLQSGGLFPADGSGLSRYNSLTSSNQLDFLEYMYNSKHFETYLESFPIGGKSGTVSDMFKTESKAVFHIKSGTLSRVKAYAGYIEMNDELVAFSFIVNNFSGRSSTMKKAMEKVLLKLAE